ncbi:PREDICTED: uncharacterized protein LOC109210576 [Nicotiana attenuata]|uniref:uncharacterized protein LOC109210576 n=1 Tax=Nicotiana attenuata TaxID=49451 RepID=UPI0009049912|nr:PREDICTED: uncharacterized protein LOC109210576 [Nicotiana attenuata]
MGSLAHLEAYQRSLAWEVHRLASLGVRLADSKEGGVVVQNRTEPLLVMEVKEKQYNDPLLVQLKEGIHKHKTAVFSLGVDDGTLRYQGRLCVPNVNGLRERIMAEAHTSRYSVHPGSMKMHLDLKEIYWWNDMKRNVADFMAKCPNCQQVKSEHQRPGGLAQNIEFPMWKWEMINMDFVVGLPQAASISASGILLPAFLVSPNSFRGHTSFVPYVLHLRLLMEQLGNTVIGHNYREQNQVVDLLAKEGARKEVFDKTQLLAVPPVFANDAVWADILKNYF